MIANVPTSRKWLLLTIMVLSTIGLTSCENPFRKKPKEQHELPVEIQRLVLDTWQPLSASEIGEAAGEDNVIDLEGVLDLDDDTDKEWLYLYRYNVVGSRGPIGGVIFDTQMITHEMELSTPYPPILSFIPYRLLPDLVDEYKSTGGYLGESGCTVEFYDTDENGRADEIAILGRSTVLSHLAIFRWVDKDIGYRMVWHAQGNGGLRVTHNPRTEERIRPGFISQVEIIERVDARFPVGSMETWRRANKDAGYQQEVEPHLDFLSGTPPRPFYPEEAALKYYNSRQRLGLAAEKEQVITGATGSVSAQAFVEMKSGFSDLALVPSGRATRVYLPRAKPHRYTGLPQTDATGQSYPRPTYADVDMDIVTPAGDLRTLTWRVVNVAKDKPNEDPEWRVLGVQEVEE